MEVLVIANKESEKQAGPGTERLPGVGGVGTGKIATTTILNQSLIHRKPELSDWATARRQPEWLARRRWLISPYRNKINRMAAGPEFWKTLGALDKLDSADQCHSRRPAVEGSWQA
jgi:hypothetical protein